MAHRSLRLILNGKKAGLPAVRKAVEKVRQDGHLVDVRTTWEAGCAARYAAEAIRDEVDVIVAGGGDGTMNEVVNGIFAVTDTPKPALGILPLGSANDFARGCGISVKNQTAALRFAATGTPHMIDVARLHSGGQDSYFVNAAICGFGADVTFQTPDSLKKVIKGAAYGLTGFLTALKHTVYTGESRSSLGVFKYETLFASLSNGLQAGGFRLAPKARLNDGHLDVFDVPDFPLDKIKVVVDDIAGLKRGRTPQFIHYDQLSWLEVEADRKIPISPDGEALLLKAFRVDVQKRCLPAVLPDGPLLKA